MIIIEKTKIAIYCRVDNGGNKEAEEETIKVQRFKLEQYLKNNGLHLSEFYEDIGYPGYDLDRPGFQKLLADYNDGKFEIVLVTSIDRLFRSSTQGKVKFPFYIKSLNSIEAGDKQSDEL